MSKIIITNIHPKEFTEVSNLLAKSWRSTYRGLIVEDFLNSLPDNFWLSFLTEGFLNQTLHCFVAKENNTIIGVSIFRDSQFQLFQSDGELTALYLLPDKIGEGFGSQLLSQTEDALRALGYTHCVLSVLHGNVRASKFYQAHGFSDTAHSEDAVLADQTLSCNIMRKKL